MSSSYSASPAQNNNDSSLSAILASHLHEGQPQQPMDARQQPEYPQSGLSSPYAHYNGHQSEGNSADQASAVQYPAGQEYKPSNFSSSATPDSSYGIPPQSARSGSFPEYIQRGYTEGQPNRYQSSAQGNHAAMAQTSSPSIPMPDGQQSNGDASQHKSDGDVPIDPSIAQSSPSYPPPQNYSPYPPQQQQEMQQHYAAQHMYARPEWAPGQYPQPMHYGHSPATSGGAPPAMVAHHIPRPPPVSRRVLRVCADARMHLTMKLTRLLGRPPSIHRLLIRAHSGCAATQASQTALRRN
jgi:hypothetical protein